jgi:DNA-binding winged helix-turn-helix (wHTH) protein
MLTLDFLSNRLSDGDHTVLLTPQQGRIIAILARTGYPVSTETLISTLWPSDEPEWANNTLKVQIHMLRKAGRRAGLVPFIATQWGSGYSLWVPVKVVGLRASAVVDDADVIAIRALLRTHPNRAAAGAMLKRLAAA